MAKDNGVKTELFDNYMKLFALKVKEAREKRLTKQLIVSINTGKIDNIRESNIITGASVLDFFISKVLQ